MKQLLVLRLVDEPTFREPRHHPTEFCADPLDLVVVIGDVAEVTRARNGATITVELVPSVMSVAVTVPAWAVSRSAWMPQPGSGLS